MPQNFSSNAPAGPSTSTPSGVKRPTQSRPTSLRNTRSRKRHKAMQDRGSLPEVEDYDSRVSKGFNDSRSDGLRGLVAHFMNFLTFRNPEAIQPMQSSASSSKSLARGKQRDQQQLQAPSHGESAIIDMTREPDEDMLFLASPRRPDLPGSASSFSSTEGGSRRRREPMYNEQQQRKVLRRAKQLAALENMSAALPKNKSVLRPNATAHGDTSNTSISSPAAYTSVSTSSISNADLESGGRGFYKPVYSTSHLGLEKYRELTGGQNFGLPLTAVRDSTRADNRDKLVHRKHLPQLHVDQFSNALEVAKSALDSPKPTRAGLGVYRRSQLRDLETSERIEDLTRRRRLWPKDVPPENEQIIRAVLKTPGVISSLPAAEVAQKDIIKLMPGEWLNDEIINFYGVMVNRRSADAKARRDKQLAEPGDENLLDVHVFTSFFFQKLVDAGYAGVRRWTKKFDLFRKDIIIMPVNLGNAHWVCAAINIEKQRFEYYDSMGKINLQVLNKLREYVKAEHLDKKKTPIDLEDWENYYNPKTPQQANGYDCGVFTSQFIECLSRRDGHFDFDQKNMPYLRKKMIHEIKMMEFGIEQWSNPNA